MNTEERLDRLVNLYEKMDEWLDMIPGLPTAVRDKIKEGLVKNKDMESLVDAIKNRRPPRFVLVGRTGVGKSSLINAMCGRYLAEVSDVKVGTNFAERYAYKSLGKTLFEVIDTRGFAESRGTGRNLSSEEQLHKNIEDFQPDAFLFLSRCKERAHLGEDAKFLRSLADGGREKVPIIALLTQADEMEPSRYKDPKEYPDKKRSNISEAEKELEGILDDHDVKPLAILPVSAYLEWNEEPTTLEPEEWSRLRIKFDGRYNINRLLDLLENNIDLRASITLMLATRVDQVGRKISEKFTKVFSSVSLAVGASPLPVADFPILLALQTALVMAIAYLSGRDMSYDTAKKFLVSLGGLGAVGFGLRALAQQASKFLNIFPGVGSATSGTIAATGTWTIGRGAIAYFFDSVPEEQLQKTVRKARDDYKDKEGGHDD